MLDNSKFEKLIEDSPMKREASLQRSLRKLKQKNFLNEIEYNKLYPSGSAPARIYGTTLTLFPFFLKLRMQIFPKKFLFPTMELVFLPIFHFKKPLK